jgi:hypothetical protein
MSVVAYYQSGKFPTTIVIPLSSISLHLHLRVLMRLAVAWALAFQGPLSLNEGLVLEHTPGVERLQQVTDEPDAG